MDCVRVFEKDSILDLLKEFSSVFPHLGEKIVSFEEYAEKLSKQAYVYKAEDNRECVGILVFYANNFASKTAYITLIGVQKGYEGKGIGKKLLDFCEKISHKYGMNTVKLEVDEDNNNAIKFYEKNGFIFLNKTGRNSFYMQKEIGGVVK